MANGSNFLEQYQLVPTDDEISQNHRYRERFEDEDEGLTRSVTRSLPPEYKDISNEDINSWVSQSAHDLVLYYEVGGESGYRRRYHRPVRPPGASGITIGFGYDVGHHPMSQVRDAWRPRLSSGDFSKLSRTVGLKGSRAQNMLHTVREIEIPWEQADEVYRLQTVPKYARWVLSIYAGIEKVHPHCFGALFSLVYNRGRSLRGNRRREMKNIRNHIRNENFDRIPDEIRAMKRIWAGRNLKGLLKRRDAEARLFQLGLDEREKIVVTPPAPEPVPTPEPAHQPAPVPAPEPIAQPTEPTGQPAPEPTPAPVTHPTEPQSPPQETPTETVDNKPTPTPTAPSPADTDTGTNTPDSTATSPAPPPTPEKIEPPEIDGTVFAPTHARRGSTITIQCLLHRPEDQAITRSNRSYWIDPSDNEAGSRTVELKLTSDSLQILKATDTVSFDGTPELVTFPAKIPLLTTSSSVEGEVTAYENNTILGSATIKVTISWLSQTEPVEQGELVG